MSKVLGNVSVVGNNTYRKLTVPATASISSLTFSTNYVKGVLLTVTSSVIIREVTIYTQVGDSNHIDVNNRFAIIVASGSTVMNTYVGWQSSWNQSNYYDISNYTFSNLLNTTPLPQKLLMDIYLEKGTYDFYLDESFNIGYSPTQDNIGYILSTTGSNFPYTDPNGVLIIGTSSNTNKTLRGNIFFNWVVSDYDNTILENGGLGLYNSLSNNEDKPLVISSSQNEVFSLSSKTYSLPLSSTISLVISSTSSNMMYFGMTTSYDSLYLYNNDCIFIGLSSGNINVLTYSQYANSFTRTFNFWTTGSSSNSDFIYRTSSIIDNLPGLPTYSNILNLYTISDNSFSYRIYDASNNNKINKTGSVYLSNGTNSNYYFVLPDISVSWPGWKISII
jgi:hypothetical protein